MYELCGQVRVNIETLALHAVVKAYFLLLSLNTVSFAARIPSLGGEHALR